MFVSGLNGVLAVGRAAQCARRATLGGPVLRGGGGVCSSTVGYRVVSELSGASLRSVPQSRIALLSTVVPRARRAMSSAASGASPKTIVGRFAAWYTGCTYTSEIPHLFRHCCVG
jgi:hypothetical protein